MAVIGGGLMGSGIATACVLAGIDVILKEASDYFSVCCLQDTYRLFLKYYVFALNGFVCITFGKVETTVVGRDRFCYLTEKRDV